MKFLLNRPGWGLLAIVLAGTGLALAQQSPQGLMGKLKGFRISPEFYPPPRASQMKSLLQGSEAEPLGGGRVQISNARLKTFREDGVGELEVSAPVCLYDTQAKRASSSGPVEGQSSDGKFHMTGVGFAWDQPASQLFISNQVTTVIQLDALKEGGAETTVKTNQHSGDQPSMLEARAHRFLYDAPSGLGTYSEAVRVTGTNLGISAELLTFKLPMNERRLQTIHAEKAVALEYSGIQALGQQADYATASGILTVTGAPSWRADTREGRADELVIERTNRTFRANGHAWLKMEGQSLGNYEFLPSGVTNAPVSDSASQRLETHSGSYEFHTNFARFERTVQVEQFADGQPQGRMTCAEMLVYFGTTNSLDFIRALGGVTISQGENRFDAGEAVYAGTNGVLDLISSPSWQSGERGGKGDDIRVDTGRQEMLVRGHAEMRFPAGEMGDMSIMNAKPNAPAAHPAAAPKSRPGAAANEMAVITAAEYRLSPKSADFQGEVHITHPQMDLECGKLRVELPARGRQVESIVAEDTVRFNLLDNQGQRLKGRANRAVYSYGVTPDGTNDVLELSGYPVLEMANGTVFQSEVIVLDRATGKLLTAPGSYHLQGMGPAPETNRFRFPATK